MKKPAVEIRMTVETQCSEAEIREAMMVLAHRLTNGCQGRIVAAGQLTDDCAQAIWDANALPWLGFFWPSN